MLAEDACPEAPRGFPRLRAWFAALARTRGYQATRQEACFDQRIYQSPRRRPNPTSGDTEESYRRSRTSLSYVALVRRSRRFRTSLPSSVGRVGRLARRRLRWGSVFLVSAPVSRSGKIHRVSGRIRRGGPRPRAACDSPRRASASHSYRFGIPI